MLIAHPNKRVVEMECRRSHVLVQFPGNDRIEMFPFDKISWVSDAWFDSFTGPGGVYGALNPVPRKVKRRR